MLVFFRQKKRQEASEPVSKASGTILSRSRAGRKEGIENEDPPTSDFRRRLAMAGQVGAASDDDWGRGSIVLLFTREPVRTIVFIGFFDYFTREVDP